jgi:hypothetical protein
VTSQGFWSYVHADDEAEGSRISRLARDVAGQFQILTGEPQRRRSDGPTCRLSGPPARIRSPRPLNAGVMRCDKR